VILTDRWEELSRSGDHDAATLAVARELANAMCEEVFSRMGLSCIVDEHAAVVSGRGLTFIFPRRGNALPVKYMGTGAPRERRRKSDPEEAP